MKADPFLTRFHFQVIAATGCLLVVVMTFLFSQFFVESHEDFTSRARQQIGAVLNALAAYERDHGFDALVSFVGALPHDPDSPFISIRSSTGKTVLHTSRDITPEAAWAASKLSIRYGIAGRGLSARKFHVVSAPLSQGMILVGQTEARPAQARDLAVVGFALLTSAAIALMFLVGLLLSGRARERVEKVRSTLSAFLAGEMDRRVPMSREVDGLLDLTLAINGTLDYAQRLLRNLNYMSADIAHNLKKPLTRLRQRLEVVSECEFANPDLTRKIDEAIQEIDSLVVIFEALLNIGQLQSRDRRSSFVKVDMSALLAHIADIYDPIVTDHGHRLTVSIPHQHVPLVSGDRELLIEMLINFLENSIQYCPEGTTITIGLREVLTGLDVFVSDNGPGVPSEDIPNLFERFYRFDRTRAEPGHGLGIPFAVAIAELHGAYVDISDNKPGLRVVIHFPNDPFSQPQLGLRLRSGLNIVLTPQTQRQSTDKI